MSTRVVTIVGGHGKIALRLARILSPSVRVKSIVRSSSHFADIEATGASPVLLSLEDAPVTDFTSAFEGSEVVVFSSGAGGKGGPERTKKVDYEGALKVFDAIERMKQPARLILVSAIDSRHPDKIPDHYNEQDIAASTQIRKAIGTYMHWKYEADKNLWGRTTFSWTIVRPGALTDGKGAGRADIGKTHVVNSIARDDVATMLALLVDRPDAAGLALDIVGGDEPVEKALDAAIRNRVTNVYE